MKVMYSSKTDLWETPQEFFDRLNKKYKFNLDVCAIPENAKCKRFYSPKVDGLAQEWKGACWMNPPYGRGISKWIKKAFEEGQKNAIVVALLPARTDTKWFHEFIYMKPGVSYDFVKGRLKFGKSKNAAPFPSMLVVFGKS